MQTLGIIGGGNMGEALVKGCQKKFKVLVSEARHERQRYLKKTYKLQSLNIETLASKSKIIALAVKPQDFDSILNELKDAVTNNKIVLSIAAGITTRYIERKLGGKPRVIRSMPNMPALIGEGMTAIAKGRFAKPGDLALAQKILGGVGEVVVVNEKLINAITAVSGSGPGHVYLFMETMIDAAKSLGLSKDLAETLVRKTFSGSIHLLEKTNSEPGEMRAKVTSKGGTTQAAHEFLKKKNFALLINQALKAGQKRAKELS